SAAIALISYLVFFHLPADSIVPPEARPAILTALTVLISLLMVSTIRYDTLPKFNKSGIMKAPYKFGGFLVCLILVIATRGSALFPLMALYLIFGAGRQLLAYVRNRGEEEDEEDTMEEEEASPFDI